jgi:hypothetical protein
MNEERFSFVMHSLDDELLEEAQRKAEHRNMWIKIAAGAVAACLCVAAVWALADGRGQNGNTVTAAEITQLGYSLPLPADAKNAEYSKVSSGAAVPMAQVTFSSGGEKYTCRALKTDSRKDISGLTSDWAESLDWSAGTLQLQLRESAGGTSWFGWYSPEDGTQWCLSSKSADALPLMHTAQQIVDTLGYEMEVAPEGAQDVQYSAFALNGLTVAETAFKLNGVQCAFRTASTADVDENFADISGKDGPYENTAAAQVSWCPARVYYNAGGEGKIVWFDIVPGLLYSLTMSNGASEKALEEMASQLYTPAQGDVG